MLVNWPHFARVIKAIFCHDLLARVMHIKIQYTVALGMTHRSWISLVLEKKREKKDFKGLAPALALRLPSTN